MEYKEALWAQMEQYYQITARYREAVVLAMKDARKLGLFKKRDYSGHIGNFQSLVKELQALEYREITIPEEDVEGQNFVKLLDRSVIAFMILCEENAKFYDLTQRKQYRNSGITIKGYAEATQELQEILSRAVNETSYLEQAYKEYFGENFTH